MRTAPDLGRFAAHLNYTREKTAVEDASKPRQLGLQQYLPLGDRREFGADEQARIEKGKRRWIPRLFQSYATDPSETMASPVKMGLLIALLGAGVGGIGGGMSGIPGGGVLGAGLGGLVGGLGGMWSQEARNDATEELMRRLPPDARLRDIMSDSIYQKDSSRWVPASSNLPAVASLGKSYLQGQGTSGDSHDNRCDAWATQKQAGLATFLSGAGIGALLRRIGMANANMPLVMGLGGAGAGAAWGALAPFKNHRYVEGKDGKWEVVLDEKTKKPVVETMGRLPSSLITAGILGTAAGGSALLEGMTRRPVTPED